MGDRSYYLPWINLKFPVNLWRRRILVKNICVHVSRSPKSNSTWISEGYVLCQSWAWFNFEPLASIIKHWFVCETATGMLRFRCVGDLFVYSHISLVTAVLQVMSVGSSVSLKHVNCYLLFQSAATLQWNWLFPTVLLPGYTLIIWNSEVCVLHSLCLPTSHLSLLLWDH